MTKHTLDNSDANLTTNNRSQVVAATTHDAARYPTQSSKFRPPAVVKILTLEKD